LGQTATSQKRQKLLISKNIRQSSDLAHSLWSSTDRTLANTSSWLPRASTMTILSGYR
jgi:hypothetical protein